MTHHFDERRHAERTNAERVALGLGLFSIGLGLAETLAPDGLARAIGAPATDRTRATLRAMGARELATGAAILMQPDRPAWLWARVGGDALDLSLLATALGSDRSNGGRLATAAAAVLGVTALDAVCAAQLQKSAGRTRGVKVEHVVTIARPLSEVYDFWRRIENFPRFMRHIESVEVLDQRRSRWRATAPAGMTVEWLAELIDDRPNERIAWRSLEDSDIRHAGEVTFTHAPGARGTEVRARFEYVPPAGALGQSLAWIAGEEPGQQLREDLRRFKQLMETGEIPLSDGPGLWRPAQPPVQVDDVTTYAGVRR